MIIRTALNTTGRSTVAARSLTICELSPLDFGTCRDLTFRFPRQVSETDWTGERFVDLANIGDPMRVDAARKVVGNPRRHI
jgi:hypothetical protein